MTDTVEQITASLQNLSPLEDEESKYNYYKNFAVIDTETTGLNPLEDGVIEVAVVKVIQGKIGPAFSCFINPQRKINPSAQAVHHISSSQLVNALPYEQVLPLLNKWLEDSEVLVAHNAPFDQSMLPNLIEKPWLDTLALAKRVYPKLEKHSNQYLRYRLNLSCPEAEGGASHRALNDCYTTAYLALHLLEKITPKQGLVELLQDLATPTLLAECTFGKHKGSKWSDVPINYLQWLRDKELAPDLRYTVEYYLRK